jgi:hypothetical protein
MWPRDPQKDRGKDEVETGEHGHQTFPTDASLNMLQGVKRHNTGAASGSVWFFRENAIENIARRRGRTGQKKRHSSEAPMG